jgi:carbon monoxide dehydrogenase subunit G
MIEFDTSIRIARPAGEVFAFVADPLQFPRWNSAVTSVRHAGGARYAMQRRLPTGLAENELEVVTRDEPAEFVLRTTSGPTPFVYRYRFAADGDATVVALDASVELRGPAALVARVVKRGVDANFATLRQILEAT